MRGLLICLTHSIIISVFAQDPAFNLGASNAAIGGMITTPSDAYSLFNNVGMLGKLDESFVLAGYQNRYGLSELQSMGAGIISHLNSFNIGAGVSKTGDDLYSEQRIQLALGSQMQQASLGVGLHLIQYRIMDFGSTHTFAICFGGSFEFSPKLIFGAYIFNLNQAKITKETGETLPTFMASGLAYRPSNTLSIGIEIEKSITYNEILKAGIDYEISENIFIRTGIQSDPSTGTFGFGFHPKQFIFDYAYTRNINLGSIHEISTAFALGR